MTEEEGAKNQDTVSLIGIVNTILNTHYSHISWVSDDELQRVHTILQIGVLLNDYPFRVESSHAPYGTASAEDVE